MRRPMSEDPHQGAELCQALEKLGLVKPALPSKKLMLATHDYKNKSIPSRNGFLYELVERCETEQVLRKSSKKFLLDVSPGPQERERR